MVYVEPDVPDRLKGNAFRLSQVITNLASNTIEFSHQRGVSVRAQLAAETGQHVTVRFAVCDTGIGLTPEQQAVCSGRFCRPTSRPRAATPGRGR